MNNPSHPNHHNINYYLPPNFFPPTPMLNQHLISFRPNNLNQPFSPVSNYPTLVPALILPKPTTKPNTYNHLEIASPQIQNVVSTVYLGCKLDLTQIAAKAKNSEYNPHRFSAAIMRLKNPRATALIFSSGKMVCTGSKSETEAKLASRKFVKFSQFQIQNIVGSCGVGFRIILDALCLDQKDFVKYEPELFPGLIYRVFTSKVIALVFKSGKVVLTGAKAKSEIEESFQNLYPILKRYMRKTTDDN